MNRHGLRVALRRSTPSTIARALQLPISTTTPISFFSTTTSLPAGDDSNSNGSAGLRSQSAAAVEKLAQLNKQRQNTTSPDGRDGFSRSRPTQLGSSRSVFRNSGNGGVDARSLRVSPAATAETGSSSPAPKILNWSREEQAVLDRLEKGEVVPFDPNVTLDSLSGYGAAVATDAPIGQVETALRAMRLMTGGMAFNSDSGVTADLTDIKKRYLKKMPIFVHSKKEKAWIESSNPKLHLVGPDAATKKAIVDTAILGKYEAAGYAEISDVRGTIANYHARTFTYMASDSQKFMAKVLSLLPAQGASKAAAQAKR
ncbi:hypothetical protein N657DRAFT_563551 [Parathielavia appendiculata]|uniref:Uncharacterized protein n=1 Tax=Parathielavia appendiculata TaxID=2587402 RepID=A0AAN6Z8V2_9PEZI|nr:hypothetical protein N657DRAFT_563551 [Parathielavia appendiculata]